MKIPGKKISILDLAAPLTGSEQIALVQLGKTVRAPLSSAQSLFADGCQCTLVSRYNTVGTDGNTLKKYLQTYTLPDDVMSVNGNWLEIHAAGLFAANGNNKQVSVGIRQNSTGYMATFDIPISGFNNDYWLIDLRVQRSSQTDFVVHQYASVTGNSVTLQTPGVLHSVGDATGVDWNAGDLQITVEATNGSASANDITCNTFIIEAHLLDPNS